MKLRKKENCSSDGIITEDERRDLARVSGLLGVQAGTVDRLLKSPTSCNEFVPEILTGTTVCFTGELKCSLNGERITREAAEEMAVAVGLKIAPRITKQVEILVVADPDTA